MVNQKTKVFISNVVFNINLFIYAHIQDLAILPLQNTTMPVRLELSISSLSSPLESLKLEDQFESGTIFDNLSRVLDEVWFGPEFLQVHQLEIGNLWAVLEIDINEYFSKIQIQRVLTRFARTRRQSTPQTTQWRRPSACCSSL